MKTTSGILRITSRKAILLCLAFWITIIAVYKPWQKNQVVNDVISYYAYLPAAIVYKDLQFKFTYKNPEEFKYKFWPEVAPNGNLVVKTTMGIALLYAPFFMIAHAVAPLVHAPQDGFSAPYQFFLLLSCFAYLAIGLLYLRKLLLLFFSERITAITIISVFAGTNLFWYSSFNGLMSHGYLFTLTTIFIYLIVKWHAAPSLKIAVFIGLTGGLITLIRPTMILSFLVFFMYGISNAASLRQQLLQFRQNIKSLVFIGIFFFVALLPQLIYWKYITGSWLFFSYIGERFYFDRPHILSGLFGFRHGWLIYTPMMIFAVLGMFMLKKHLRQFFLPVMILFPLLVYVFFSWWAWWYGGAFGLRAFVDFYGLFALPMACFYKEVLEGGKGLIKTLVLSLTGIFICLNLFQSWQFHKGYLHHDSMTKDSYLAGFFATKYTDKWFEGLDEPDYSRARQGLPEAFPEEDVMGVKPSDIISFKGCNTFIVSCELSTTKELDCSRNWISQWEKFSLIRISGNKYALKTSEGKYVSLYPVYDNKLIGSSDGIGKWETFEMNYLGNNRISLKAANNKYVKVSGPAPCLLYANAASEERAAQFRIFIN